MKRIVIGLSVDLLIAALSCAAVWAQATAQISGTVRSPTSAELSGAGVTVTQTDTGFSRNTLTNQIGSYVLPNLAIGPYRLEVSLPGYRTFVQTGIVLQVDTNAVINAVLQAGQVSEQVQVQANAPMVETRGSGIGQVIENEQILQLPYGRNVNALAVLAGAAVQDVTLNLAGGLGFAAEQGLDGATYAYTYTGQSLPLPFPDTLRELKVETSGLPAKYGQGTAVTSVTRAGTNMFHGDAFEFLGNDRFNARNYFATTKSKFRRNQFGGILGGPIVGNKLFFFGGYQRTTLRQDPTDHFSVVPTATMLAGDWTAFGSAACNGGRQVSLRAPFVNNRLDPVLFSKVALNIVNRLPKSNDPCGSLIFSSRTISNQNQVVSRVDYQWTDKHSLFGRYAAMANRVPHPFTFTPDNILNVSGTGVDDLFQAFAVGDTYQIGSNMVNALHLAVNRMALARTGAEYFGPTDLGINSYSYIPKALTVSVTGGFALAGQGDSTYRTTTYQVSDDVSLVKGRHEMSFGENIAQSRSNTNLNSAPNFSFSGQGTGLGLADFFLGRPSLFTNGAPNALYMRQWYVGLYGQDIWKLKPRLTMNYGVRWEPFLPPVSGNGRVYNFDYDRFRQGIRSTVFRNAPAGFYYPGDPGFPGKSGIHTQWLNFGPRLGLAWDLLGDGRTSVRASYGLSYDYLPLQWRIGAVRAGPWAIQTVVNAPSDLENPWQGVPGGDPFPLKFDQNAQFPPYGSYETTPYDIHTPSVSSWNLGIQRDIGADWLLSTTYLGSQAVHVWVQKPLNSAIYLPGGSCPLNGVTFTPCSMLGNTNQRRRLNLERPQDFVGLLDEFDDGGTQSYNGLLLSVQRRASRSVTLAGNYTWSHCIGDYGDSNGLGPSAGSSIQDPNNRDFDRGNCDSDRRHIFNLTGIAETPHFANNTLRALATGWRLSGIYRKSSGRSLTIFSGIDRALTGVGGQRPDQLLADPYGDKSGRPLTNYLNAAAFAQPALGKLGNVGRANVQGPGAWQFDAALSKEFLMRESQRLEFRAEAYNVLNSFRPGNPDTNVSSNIWGQIRTALDPRIIQFALKYIF